MSHLLGLYHVEFEVAHFQALLLRHLSVLVHPFVYYSVPLSLQSLELLHFDVIDLSLDVVESPVCFGDLGQVDVTLFLLVVVGEFLLLASFVHLGTLAFAHVDPNFVLLLSLLAVPLDGVI